MLQTIAYAVSRVIPAVVQAGVAVSQCSVFMQDGVLGATGAPSGNYSVAVLTNIPCLDAATREASLEARDVRNIPETQTEGYRHIFLMGRYFGSIFPLIQSGLQARITDADETVNTYNLEGVEPDSQAATTRLKLKVISV